MDFKDLLVKVDMVEFLISRGYTLKRKDSKQDANGWKYGEFTIDGDTIVVLRSKTPPFNHIYFNRSNSDDKGNVISFLLKKEGMTKKQCYDVLSNFTGYYTYVAVEQKPVFLPEEHWYSFVHNVGVNEEYFNCRGLSPDDVRAVVNPNSFGVDKNGNTLFFLRDGSGRVVGIESKGFETLVFEGKKTFVDSIKAGSLWLNNLGLPFEKKMFIMGEAVLDVLSYCTLKGLKKEDGVLLAASCGAFSSLTVENLKGWMDKLEVEEIRLVNDNDKTGWKNDVFTAICLYGIEAFTQVKVDERQLRVRFTNNGLLEKFEGWTIEDNEVVLEQDYVSVNLFIRQLKKEFNGKYDILIDKTEEDWNQVLMDQKSLKKEDLKRFDSDFADKLINKLQYLVDSDIEKESNIKKLNYFKKRVEDLK